MEKPLSAEIIYPTAEEVLATHLLIVNRPSASASDVVRDWNLLESALNRPRAAAYYEGADLVRQAATLVWGMVENHPFHDGNKRTAWIAMRTFLHVNGWQVAGSEDERFALVIGVTQGLSVDDVDAWLRAHSRQAP